MTAQVSGRVQGVGFRWWIRSRADALNLTGWVMNDADERLVAVVAEGAPRRPGRAGTPPVAGPPAGLGSSASMPSAVRPPAVPALRDRPPVTVGRASAHELARHRLPGHRCCGLRGDRPAGHVVRLPCAAGLPRPPAMGRSHLRCAGNPGTDPGLRRTRGTVAIGATFFGLTTRQMYGPPGSSPSTEAADRPELVALDCADGTLPDLRLGWHQPQPGTDELAVVDRGRRPACCWSTRRPAVRRRRRAARWSGHSPRPWSTSCGEVNWRSLCACWPRATMRARWPRPRRRRP